MLINRLLAGTALAGALLSGLTLIAPAAMAQEVTPERLENAGAEEGNWLMVHRSYDSHRYSPLDEINLDTVEDLELAFVTPLNPISGGGRYSTAQNEGTPLAEDGFLYIQSGWSVISKVDARDGKWGKVVWQVEPEIDREYVSDTACCGAENRGIGLWRDQVIALTLDGRMMSIDKNSGEITWERQIADQSRAETFTVAPLVVGDVAIIGPAGGEYGIRGWIEAVDLETGETAWRTYTIPGPGEPGHETWEGEDWKTGGGSIWQTGSYDPELDLIYWGTGNPAPQFDAEYRPGDNLYTESLLALDADTGEIVWHFQFTPNDPFDYDEVGDNQLIEVEIDGETREIVARGARNGFVYGLDRETGEFLWGNQYVEILNWTDGLDPETGLPNSYDPDLELQVYNGIAARRGEGATLLCPGLTGGKNWQPASYSELTELLYVPASEGCHNVFTAEEAPVPTVVGGEWELTDPAGWRGRGFAGAEERPEMPAGEEELAYSITGIDPATGEIAVKRLLDIQAQGLLTTAGGLLFASDRAGYLTAYDAETLEPVWQWNAGTALYGPPMTYSVDGKQYVAVLAGGAASGGDDPAIENFIPQDSLYVFAL